MHIHKKPVAIFVLPEGAGRPKRLLPEEADAFMEHYEDTGWEPKLDKLYEACRCDTIDMRTLPIGHLWFDDEGRLKERMTSPIASLLYTRSYATTENIVGDAVLVIDPTLMSDKDAEEFVMSVDRMLVEHFTGSNRPMPDKDLN